MADTTTSNYMVTDEQVNFDVELDLEEDIAAELEDFIFLARLGVVDDASALVRNVLWPHAHQFPVFAEISSFLAEHDLDSLKILLQEFAARNTSFTDDEEKEFINVISLFIGDVSTAYLENQVSLISYLMRIASKGKSPKLSPVKVGQ